jgi:diguanylate cyclase (GGDEF)-like protein/PAS domain S-box-containing protein
MFPALKKAIGYGQFILTLVLFAFVIQSAFAEQLASPALTSPPTEKVRLQLKWFHQFQFSGYYAALEQGYYAEENLDVEILERNLSKSVVKQVVSGEAEYGVADSGLLSHYALGEPVIALAAIFQHNPLVFFSLRDSGIISPFEIKGMRIMSDTGSADEAPLRAMLAGVNITKDDYTLIPQNNNYELLEKKRVDVISGYLTNEPFYFKQKGVKVNVINPQNYGIDFYGDMLFTSQSELRNHPDRVARFRRASLKGWQYAMAHPEALIQLIRTKYHSRLSVEHLKFEAAEARRLILPDVIPVGLIQDERMRMMAKAYSNSGHSRVLTDTEVADFIYTAKQAGLGLTASEKALLVAHPVLRVGVDSDFPPYEWIDKQGHYVGVAADYMKLLEKKLGVRFEIVHGRPWGEILDMAKRDELELLACANKTPERSQYLFFSEPFMSAFAVIIDSGQGGFIGNLDNLAGKRVAVEKDYFMQELMRKDYPKIQLVPVANTTEALKRVQDGLADAYVGDASTANYIIKKNGFVSLRFSGQTEYRSIHSVAVVKTHPELAGIIAKAMESISREESEAIFNRWLGLNIEPGVRTETLLKYAAGAGLIFLIFAYWVYRLRREIAYRKQAESQVSQSESRLRTIIENEPECIKIVDAAGRLTQMNHAGLKMIEADSLAQVAGHPVLDLIAPEYRDEFATMHRRVLAGEAVQMEFEVVGLKGGRRWLETHAVPMQEYGRTVHLAVTRDVSERKKMEEQIHQLAFYDTLTHLPNRRLMVDRLEQNMITSRRTGRYGALMFLDLDNFKPLNDTHGHVVGDLLLVEVAARLKYCVRETDSVSRFGGDEFVVMLSELDVDQAESIGQSRVVAEKIRAALSEPYLLTAQHDGLAATTIQHHCTASIGVAVFINHNASQDDIIKWADLAMYEAKAAGRNQIRFYQADV